MSRPEPPAEDTAPPAVGDHAYEAPPGAPWERCNVCGLAESAHATTSNGGYAEHLRRAYAPPSSGPQDHIGHRVVMCFEGGAASGLRCEDCDMAIDQMTI